MQSTLAPASIHVPADWSGAKAPIGFALSEEQTMLCDTLRRFFREKADESGMGRGPIEPRHWRELGDLGLAAIMLPESAGGLGGGPRDAALIAEEFGRALAITPLAEGLAGAADLIARYGDERAMERWVAPALVGEGILALAQGTVRLEGTGSLTGVVPFVRWAPEARGIVLAVGDDAYVFGTDADGLRMETTPLIDRTPMATLHLQGVLGDRLSLAPGALASSLAVAQLCYVGEMVGAMALLYEQTVEYVQQRKQFGVAIGTFQAVQHKLARMFVMLEQARSLLLKATLCDRQHAAFIPGVTGAKAYVADAAQRLGEEAVQLHGGIGITDELVVGRGLRRITVLARLFGTADDARAQLAA